MRPNNWDLPSGFFSISFGHFSTNRCHSKNRTFFSSMIVSYWRSVSSEKLYEKKSRNDDYISVYIYNVRLTFLNGALMTSHLHPRSSQNEQRFFQAWFFVWREILNHFLMLGNLQILECPGLGRFSEHMSEGDNSCLKIF